MISYSLNGRPVKNETHQSILSSFERAKQRLLLTNAHLGADIKDDPTARCRIVGINRGAIHNLSHKVARASISDDLNIDVSLFGDDVNLVLYQRWT